MLICMYVCVEWDEADSNIVAAVDISELDGGECAKAIFPNANDLMNFQVVIAPDDGYWKGCKYTFNFSVPDMYPHDPPKVKCINKVSGFYC